MEDVLLYDPPTGWKYGFPRQYLPLEGEKLEDTLIRDGYPRKDAKLGADHCRFIGSMDKIEEFRRKGNI